MISIQTEEISLETHGHSEVINITPQIDQLLRKTEYDEGQVTIFIPGSTGGITNIEYEPGLLKDLPEFLDQILPARKRYHHDDTWHDGNGYAHLRSALIKPFFTIPFKNGRLILGTWQQVIFIDFDNRSRNRTLVVQFLGRKK